MPCYSPLTGWRARRPNPSGKYSIVFVKNEGYADTEISIPCGQCIGCRLDYSRNWALRCMHEAQLHKENCFITLTYEDENLPLVSNMYPTLDKSHFQKFMKRLRKKFGDGIRYYACGEYGDQNDRPHYHACIFGLNFPDRVHEVTKNGNHLYSSKILQKLWPFGFSTIGELTFETAAYTARYCMKKAKGKNKESHYERLIPETGEITQIEPEFSLMSRRPGIGRDWIDNYRSDVYPHDFTVVSGRQMKPPKYYDAQIEKYDADLLANIKASRRVAAKKDKYNNSLVRLHARGKVKKNQIKTLKREL
jgi:hypothetical protein